MLVYLYKLINRFNDKEYVGITSRPVKDRFHRHVYSAKAGSNSRIHKAIRKWGREAFEIETLDTVDTAEAALKLETKLIKKHGTLWPKGYNAVAKGGGTWGLKYSEESKQRISEATKGRVPWNKGRKMPAEEKAKVFTPQWRKNQSERHKGRPVWNKGIPVSPEHSKKLSRALKKRYSNPNERKKTGKQSAKFWREHPEKAAQMGRTISKIRAKRFWSSKRKRRK